MLGRKNSGKGPNVDIELSNIINNYPGYTGKVRTVWVSVDNFIIPCSIGHCVNFVSSHYRLTGCRFVPRDYEILRTTVHISASVNHQWFVQKEGLQSRRSHVIQKNQLSKEEKRFTSHDFHQLYKYSQRI